jgi:hypothetical protein
MLQLHVRVGWGLDTENNRRSGYVGRKKKHRCVVPGCGLVIKQEFLYCYAHRKRGTFEFTETKPGVSPPTPKLKVFFCEKCGDNSHSAHLLLHCMRCGNRLEEVL